MREISEQREDRISQRRAHKLDTQQDITLDPPALARALECQDKSWWPWEQSKEDESQKHGIQGEFHRKWLHTMYGSRSRVRFEHDVLHVVGAQ